MNTTELTPTDLLRLITAELKLHVAQPTKVDCLIALNRFLLEQLERGLNTVLIIDEAQNLDPRVLEEVRLLSNLETDSEKLLQIVLTGQPELREKLAAPNLRQLRQRVAIEHHVKPLAPTDVRPYLRHRIETAGGRYEDVFEPGSEPAFFEFSQGCPRLLSLLADRSLLAAFSKQVRPVPGALVTNKAKDLAAARVPMSPLDEV
jgi:general secretion pathway protein A